MSKVIRIKIHQPNAHYRVPFAYKRRFTYPIPPYSTIKGLICNLLGIKSDNQEDFISLKNGLSIFVCGKHETLVNEYIWFRNLEIDKHKDKFGTINNRSINSEIEHIGGQIPVNIDTLHNNDLTIYLHHKNYDFQKKLELNIKNPVNRNTIIHLGRAEDWLVFNEIKEVELEKKVVRSLPYFSWIPQNESIPDNFKIDNYSDFFKSINGNLLKLPTFYNSNNGQRNFYDHIRVKLFEGGSFKRQELFVDPEMDNLPVILAELKG